MEPMTQTAFAKYAGCSQPLVSRYIRDGVITKRSIVREGGKVKIIPDLALQDMERNLHPGQRKKEMNKPLAPRLQRFVDEYREKIWFDVHDGDELWKRLQHALDMLAFISWHFEGDTRDDFEGALDTIAGIFCGELVNVELLEGGRRLILHDPDQAEAVE